MFLLKGGDELVSVLRRHDLIEKLMMMTMRWLMNFAKAMYRFGGKDAGKSWMTARLKKNKRNDLSLHDRFYCLLQRCDHAFREWNEMRTIGRYLSPLNFLVLDRV